MNKKKKYTEIKIRIYEGMDSERAKNELGNAIYKTAVLFYEHIGERGTLTDNKKLYGNGHHMAQNISEQARKLWEERLIDN